MCDYKKCGKIFSLIIVAIAVLLAILASTLPPEHIDYVIIISRFFDIMIPVLGVGALIKYLCSSVCETCDKNDRRTD